MGYSKYELSKVNMLYSLGKFVMSHPFLPITTAFPKRPLSSAPKVAVVERFDCILSYWITRREPLWKRE